MAGGIKCEPYVCYEKMEINLGWINQNANYPTFVQKETAFGVNFVSYSKPLSHNGVKT